MQQPHFGGPRRQDLLDAALRLLRTKDVADPVWEAQTLLARCLGLQRLDLIRDPEQKVEPHFQEKFAGWLARYASGEPMAYLEGSVGFYGYEFKVDQRVLVPRADSECVVEAALDWMEKHPPGLLVDVGVGSGCLLMTLLLKNPHWCGVGIDFSADALAVAASNRSSLKLEARCSLIQGSWLDACASLGMLDLVVSNPPYVVRGEELGPGVFEHEPHLALFVPAEEAMEPYHIIANAAKHGLRPNGGLIFEVGAGRASEVQGFARRAGFRHIETRKDLAGVERAVVLERG